eukprot:2019595-Amphidinium_carterae.1
MREASSPLDVDKVCPTPVATCPKQMLLQQYLIGESTDKSTAWMDYGVFPLPIRSSLVGRGAARVGTNSARNCSNMNVIAMQTTTHVQADP